MSWHSTELKDSVQVHPSYEHGHVLGLGCWCGPRIEQEADWPLPMVVHRDELQRSGPDDPFE